MNHVIPKERQPQLPNILIKSIFRSVIVLLRHDREPNRILARTQELLNNTSRKVREFVYECILNETIFSRYFRLIELIMFTRVKHM